MLDRFKFRSWVKSCSMMVSYEDYVKNGKEIAIYINKRFEEMKINVDPMPPGIYMNDDDDLVWMQCTGIGDKNENLIFEGDIISGEGIKKPMIVKWYNHSWVMFEDENTYGFIMDKDYFYDWEIIGNIYENPELLEGLQNDNSNKRV